MGFEIYHYNGFSTIQFLLVLIIEGKDVKSLYKLQEKHNYIQL